MSAMRPSMMTLVSRILKLRLACFLAAENAAQRRQVQHVALIGAHHQADIGHQQHDEELKEALRRSRRDAVADDEAEKVGADDAEDAADDGTDQPFQADLAQTDLEQHNRCTKGCPDDRSWYSV